MTLKIDNAEIHKALQKSLNELLSGNTKNYSPLVDTLNNYFGYSIVVRNQVQNSIAKYINNEINKPKFQAQLKEAVIKELARRYVNNNGEILPEKKSTLVE